MNGMDDVADDDFFSEDGFDDLQPDEILALEQSAISSTQRERQQQPQHHHDNGHVPSVAPDRRPYPDIEDYQEVEGLEEDVIDNGESLLPVGQDWEGIPRHTAGDATQREQWRLNRFTGPASVPQATIREANRIPVALESRPQRAEKAVQRDYQSHDDLQMLGAEEDYEGSPRPAPASGARTEDIATLRAQLQEVGDVLKLSLIDYKLMTSDC